MKDERDREANSIARLVVPRTEKVNPQECTELPFIGLDDIESHTMRLLDTKCALEMKSAAKRFYRGDVLYSRLRPYLNKVWSADRDGICSSEFIVMPGNENIDAKFLTLRLNASDFVSFANSLNLGDRPRVDFNQISSFILPPFSLEQQRQVVARIEQLFSELDKGIESLKTAREQLRIYRQALLKHAFEGKLTEQWRKGNADKLETPEQLLARIQKEREARYQYQLEEWKLAVKEWESNGKEEKKPGKPKKPAQIKNVTDQDCVSFPELPLGWGYVRLGMLIDEPTYGTSAKCSYDSGEQSVLRIPNIADGVIDDTDLKFATFEKGEINHLRLEAGDILIIRSNGSISLVGSCALVKEKDARHIFAGYLIRLRSNKNLILSTFLLAVMSSHSLRKQIELAAKSTSGVNNINTGELQNLIVPLPPLEEQTVITKYLSERISSIGAVEEELVAQLSKANVLRQSILKKAFSGQLFSSKDRRI